MTHHTFTPGQRVRDTGGDRLGIVAQDQSKAAEYPGLIEIHWADGWSTVADPSILAPVADALEPGNIVTHTATGVHGKLTSTNGTSAVVEWDAAGVAMPGAILPVSDIEHIDPWAAAGREPNAWGDFETWEELAAKAPATAGLEAFTEAEIKAELQRRWDASYEAARVTAVEYLQETPELTTQKTTVTQLLVAARETGLPAAALMEAWGIVTGAEL